MRRSVLFVGCAAASIFLSQACLAGDDGRIVAKFSYSRPDTSDGAFKRDRDLCIRKASVVSFEDQVGNGSSRDGAIGRSIRMKVSHPDPRDFNRCMLAKSYRLDPSGSHDTGWITFYPGKETRSL